MYYRPKLGNGKLVALSWPLYCYRLLNFICWPLEDNAGFLAWTFDRLYYIFGILIWMGHNETELHYLYLNLENIDELLTGMPTYLILIEILLRAFQLGLHKEKFKQLLKQFYAEIYIDESENPKSYRSLQKRLRLTYVVSTLYFLTLGLYSLVTVMNIVYNVREPIYKMAFFFDHTPIYIYYPILFANFWVGIIVVSMVYGELNVVAQFLLHLNGRFLCLRSDLENCAERLLEEADPACIASEFQAELKSIIARSVELYKFAAKVQNEFSFRIFVWFAFSAGLLCALGFKVYTNPRQGIPNLCWCSGKILELTSIGELGSTLIETTDKVSSMYYHSKWELIIERSSNTHENVRLMKLILNAMETSQKPVFLTGLSFFHVSLTAVVTILQGAGSYFTCLTSLR